MELAVIHNIHSTDYIVSLEQFDPVKWRFAHVHPGSTNRTGKALTQDLEHFVSQHSSSTNNDNAHKVARYYFYERRISSLVLDTIAHPHPAASVVTGPPRLD
jgi:hypothetical protein